MDTGPAGESVTIGLPTKCTYRGGHSALGKHAKNLRIKDGNIGFGEFHLTHSIPLDTVASIEVVENEFGGSEEQTFVAMGATGVGSPRRVGRPASEPKQVTEITVRTKDGQDPVWEVEHRGAEWVRERLTPALRQARIPYYDDLPPSERAR
jgi:hypothetical protein